MYIYLLSIKRDYKKKSVLRGRQQLFVLSPLNHLLYSYKKILSIIKYKLINVIGYYLKCKTICF